MFVSTAGVDVSLNLYQGKSQWELAIVAFMQPPCTGFTWQPNFAPLVFVSCMYGENMLFLGPINNLFPQLLLCFTRGRCSSCLLQEWLCCRMGSGEGRAWLAWGKTGILSYSAYELWNQGPPASVRCPPVSCVAPEDCRQSHCRY